MPQALYQELELLQTVLARPQWLRTQAQLTDRPQLTEREPPAREMRALPLPALQASAGLAEGLPLSTLPMGLRVRVVPPLAPPLAHWQTQRPHPQLRGQAPAQPPTQPPALREQAWAGVPPLPVLTPALQGPHLLLVLPLAPVLAPFPAPVLVLQVTRQALVLALLQAPVPVLILAPPLAWLQLSRGLEGKVAQLAPLA